MAMPVSYASVSKLFMVFFDKQSAARQIDTLFKRQISTWTNQHLD
jgi:hypothetical protein